MKIEANIDIDKIKKQIEASKTIKGDEEYFTSLSVIQDAKNQIKDAEDALKTLEADVKGLIDSKAKAMLGDNWTVIDGEKIKITKSATGNVYNIVGDPNSKFIEIKKSVNTNAVEEYVTKNSKLPKGIETNLERGWSMRIKLK